MLDGNALGRGPRLFPHRRRLPFARPRLPRLVARRCRLGVLHAFRARSRERRRPRRRDSRYRRRRASGRPTAATSSTCASTPTTGPRASSATGSARARRATCSSTRSRMPASSSMSARRSRDRFILIQRARPSRRRRCGLIPADAPEAEPTLIAPRETAVEYHVDEAHGTFFILTNAGGAKDFKIVTAPVDAPGRENWQDLVPHAAGPPRHRARRDGAAPGAAGALRRAAAHRRPPPRRRRGAHHRLRRGGLRARA